MVEQEDVNLSEFGQDESFLDEHEGMGFKQVLNCLIYFLPL